MSEFRVVSGDCRAVMAAMPDKSFDAVITDIPYGEVNGRTRYDVEDRLRDFDKGAADTPTVSIRLLAREFARLSRSWVYVFCGTEQVSVLRRMFRRLGMQTRLGVWLKTDPSPANGEYNWLSGLEACVVAKHPASPFFRFCKAAAWTGPIARDVDWHPTPKPAWLMRELVTASVPEGGHVLDPFMGSGSVGVACMAENRHFTGIELNAEWAELARTRIANVNLDLFHGAA